MGGQLRQLATGNLEGGFFCGVSQNDPIIRWHVRNQLLLSVTLRHDFTRKFNKAPIADYGSEPVPIIIQYMGSNNIGELIISTKCCRYLHVWKQWHRCVNDTGYIPCKISRRLQNNPAPKGCWSTVKPTRRPASADRTARAANFRRDL